MRFLTVAILLVLAAGLGAVDLPTRNLFADSLSAEAVAMLPAGRAVLLEVAADDWTSLLTDRLKTRLLQDGLRLLTGGSADGVTLEVGCSVETVTDPGWLDLSNPKTHYRFTLQVTDNATGQILAYRTREFLEDAADPDHLRWYDPILVSAVIGGLIYLFYFGAK